MFRRYVASVLDGCSKSTSMLHMLQLLYTYVASVCFQCLICVFGRTLQVCLSRCCICFAHMCKGDVAYVCNRFQENFQVFFASVLEACFKCFICLQTYVASVAFGYFKSRLSVAYLMHMGSRRGAIHPRTQSSDAGDVRTVGLCVGARNAGTTEGVLAA
jgi:hypothetical protein